MDNAAIVTFESHGAKEYEDYKKIQITASIFSALFFCGAALCLGFLIKFKKANASIKN